MTRARAQVIRPLRTAPRGLALAGVALLALLARGSEARSSRQTGPAQRSAAQSPRQTAQSPHDGAPPRRYSTIDRLSDQRLAATHQSGDELRESVSRPAPLPGLTDYRAIFHAHASDSEHTGGTLDELLEDAKRVHVEIVFLSDHPSPPRDFMHGWRGVREGCCSFPAPRPRTGFCSIPTTRCSTASTRRCRTARRRHLGQRPRVPAHLEDHESLSFDGVTGTEIYNRHADAKDEAPSMAAMLQWITDPAGITRLRNAISKHPIEVFAAQQDYPADYLAAWDRARPPAAGWSASRPTTATTTRCSW